MPSLVMILGLSNTASKQDILTPTNRFYRIQVLPKGQGPCCPTAIRFC